MSRSTTPHRNRTRLAALAAVTTGLGLTAFGLPTLAFGAGAPTSVTYDTGSLDWGVKASFRNYVTGPAGGGSVDLTGGATTNADGSYHFNLASAGYDPTTHSLNAAFTGGVRFLAHDGALDVAISDLRITTSGTTGTLTADTASKETVGAPAPTLRQDVPLATFTVARDTTNGTATPAKLTAEGAKAFAGFYQAGAELDPLSIVLKQSTTAPSPTPTDRPTTEPTGEPSTEPTATPSTGPTGRPTTEPTTEPTATPTSDPSSTASPGSPSPSASTPTSSELAVVDGRLEWGVKEGFRTYVTGPIAAGKVQFDDGASDYRFGSATGSYRTDTHALTADFAGSVRFLGHQSADGHYELDTRLSHLGVRVDASGAFLVADVAAATRGGAPVSLSGVRLAELDLSKADFKPVDGVVTLRQVPAKLTADGVPAFGTYQAGEALDALTVTLTFDRNATLPTPTPAPTSGTTTTDTTGATLTTSAGPGGELAFTGGGSNSLPLLATAAGLVLLGGATTALVRRRTTQDPTTD
ncbi:HtaA domain-containing protein [Kitasatospora sp. NPDC092948]|uniref:HtaA domain-containing protein n=1 Tax=Kitasatospora sp. NPDC092948 TaxID=3364088 RepID=UPI003817C41B